MSVADRLTAEIAADFRGELVRPEDTAYDAASRIFNDRVRRRPALIARCAGVADVRAALRLAREAELELSVRGGGHGIAGWASNDGGVVVDLTAMRWVHVDPASATAWVGGGAQAIDVITEAEQFGLAPVTGTSTSVGVVGLVTGAGEGYLTPQHGFGSDNLLAAQIVTPDGTVLHASAHEHAELLWGIRGAGPNFGVVTAVQVRLHPLPQRAVGGWMSFAAADVPHVTRHLLDVMQHGSPYFCPQAAYVHDAAAGELRLLVLPAHVGPEDVAEREIGELRRCAPLLSDATAKMSYRDLIHQIPGTHGGRRVWDLCQLPFDGDRERQVELLLDAARALAPNVALYLWRTVLPEAARAESAVPHREGITVTVLGGWERAEDDEEELRRHRELAELLAGSGLVVEGPSAMNHVSVFDERRVVALYGVEPYERLRRLKRVHDPGNRLRRNYNVPPAS